MQGKWIAVSITVCFTVGSWPAWAEDKKEEATKTLKEVMVKAVKPELEAPFLQDVKGTKIYSGKKTSLVRLKELPAIVNNNYRQALVKVPGLILSEETTPLVSIGYRGLDPHRSQFVQVLKDGIPIHADQFGYPEAYYTPILQSVDNIEFIRGGAALMYGPQPGGVLNYVTKKPYPGVPFAAYTENAFGSDNLFSTYSAVTGNAGKLGYYGYIHERQTDGFRTANSDFEVLAGSIKLTINQTGKTRFTGVYEEYHEEHGEPGGLTRVGATRPKYDQLREFATRQFDRFRLERYYAYGIFEKEFSENTQFDFRTYGGRYRRFSKRQRGGAFGTVPGGGQNDIEEQNFYNLGWEPRFRHHYELLGGQHTFTIGTHNFFSHTPRLDSRGAGPAADSGDLRREAVRDIFYFATFAENLFRWWKFKVTPGVRLEHYWMRINEKRNVDKTTVPLERKTEYFFVPLFGLGVAFEVVRGIEVYSNISQSYRPKVFTEFVPTGANQVVVGGLNEGRAVQYDFGFRGKPVPFLSWDVDYFILEFENQVGSVGNTIQNVGDSRNHGTEMFAEVDLVGAFDFLKKTSYVDQIGSIAPFFALTVMDADFVQGRSDGRRPRFAPQYNFRFGTQWRWRDRVKVNLQSTFVDDHFADDAGTLNFIVPSYKVWDLTAEVQLFKNAFNAFGMSIFGGVNNLFDEEYYARIRADGIDPAYRRNIYGGVKVNWG